MRGVLIGTDLRSWWRRHASSPTQGGSVHEDDIRSPLPTHFVRPGPWAPARAAELCLLRHEFVEQRIYRKHAGHGLEFVRLSGPALVPLLEAIEMPTKHPVVIATAFREQDLKNIAVLFGTKMGETICWQAVGAGELVRLFGREHFREVVGEVVWQQNK